MAETPREILAAWSDRDDMADCILRDLDQQGYAIVPKEPTSIMCMTGERAGMTWLAECKADITVREARPTITAEIYRAMVEQALKTRAR